LYLFNLISWVIAITSLLDYAVVEFCDASVCDDVAFIVAAAHDDAATQQAVLNLLRSGGGGGGGGNGNDDDDDDDFDLIDASTPPQPLLGVLHLVFNADDDDADDGDADAAQQTAQTRAALLHALACVAIGSVAGVRLVHHCLRRFADDEGGSVWWRNGGGGVAQLLAQVEAGVVAPSDVA
jgi:hypothetical protein